MEKSVAQFTNKGMYQDVSISKATNEFAFENRNIRITALDDHTLFSITNERGPAVVINKSTNEATKLTGSYVGHAVLNDKIILFTHNASTSIDYIYKLIFEENKAVVTELYHGKLDFSVDNPLQTLPYYESEEVQKVYWVDGINQPRVINIMNIKNPTENTTQFDFTSSVTTTPKISVEKKYEGVGLFPAGIIQYFVSYYNKYSSETPILAATPLLYINNADRGAAPDDILTCNFDITLSNLDTNFDYVKVYSLKRTSYNGEVQCSIVSDMNINSSELHITDTNTNQSSEDPTKLYFLGGGNFIAETISSKDNTLFLGNISSKTNDNTFSTLKSEIAKTITPITINGETIQQSSLITFSTKTFPKINISGYYVSDMQSKNNSSLFKTFKRGEIYRFALQFQDTKGIWSDPIWAGDLYCNVSPTQSLNDDDNTIAYSVADIQCSLNSSIKTICNNKYLNYRVLIADTTNSQSIVAQGVVCPTVFNYAERYKNQIFSKASWIMRPRNGNAEWRHLGSVGHEIQSQDSNIGPFTNNYYVNSDGVEVENVTYDSIILTISIYKNHDAKVRLYNATSSNIKINKKVKELTVKSGTWKTTYSEINSFFSDDVNNFSQLLTEDAFLEVARPSENAKDVTIPNGWIEHSYVNIPKLKRCIYKKIDKNSNKFTTKSDLTFEYKKNNYYVDNSIVTFHSPDIENIINNSDLDFRIVGVVPITASYSDINGSLKNKGLSSESSFHKEGITNISNKAVFSEYPKTLLYGDLYSDYGWNIIDEEADVKQYIPNTSFENYPIYLWHKQGSIVGQNTNTYLSSDLNTIDEVTAELKNKIFGTQLFSLYSKYFNTNNYWSPNAISKVQVLDGDSLNTTKLNMYRIGDSSNYLYGVYKIYSSLEDKLLTHSEPYYIKDLEQYDPISIKYKTTKHAAFGLLDTVNKVSILPKLSKEDTSEKAKDIYEYLDNKNPNYSWITENTKPLGGHNALIIPSWMIEQDSGHYVSNKTIVWGDIYNYLKDSGNHYQGFPLRKIRPGMLIMLADTPNNQFNKVDITNCKISVVCKLTSSFGATGDVYYKGDSGFTNGGVYDLYGILEDNIAFDIKFGIGTIDSDGNIEYIQDGIYYDTQGFISGESADNYPYLYLAELHKKIPYNSLYGGYNENALEQINWIPSTSEYPISAVAKNAEGDTYYQRWDCLKSYPYTEEDTNKVVNITSFMVETRQNLEGRYDRNIGTTNILNLRPTNFNLFNKSYSQLNNFFTYNILDNKFINKNLKNQIIWSLVKTSTADIDNWTMITTNSALNIDGSYGAINKLMCYNDTILAFQDKGISVINFNNRTALSTEGGLPVEIANSGKVDGYRMLSSTSGCTDKNLSIITNNGLYYVDIYNNALYRFNSEGLSNISEKGMSVWFRNNTKNIKRLLYDFTTQDLYIITDSESLLFNEKLQTFTTFIDNIDSKYKALFNVEGNSFILNSGNNVHVNKMYAGGYSPDYKMVYRINPDPLMDKVFTNIEYLSELYSGDSNVNKSPFEYIEVENDYQYGKTLVSDTKYPMNTRKFRIWRMDLPRDTNSRWGLDRIRSPWITLTLNGKNDGERMEFHNLNVIYYK